MNKHSGFTLIEIMIALVLGLIVVGGGITIYGLVVRGSADTVRSLRLNYDLESVMSLMVNDIRRAGYWFGAISGADSTSNPFTQATTDIQILNGGNCILYSYDADMDGIVDSNEYYGFRLSNSMAQIRSSGSTTSNCNDGIWDTLTVADGAEQIDVTNLQFSFAPIVTPNVPGQTQCLDKTNGVTYTSTCALVMPALTSGTDAAEIRQVNIVIGGRVSSDTTVTKLVSDTVKVRNDRIFTQ